MTTSHSSLSRLKGQADKIAQMIKASERGEKIDVRFAEKIREARTKEVFVVGIAMDDKFLKIDIPWVTIRQTSEVALAAYILKQMKGSRETLQ